MKKFFNWQVILGLFLTALSAVVYSIHYAVFKDAYHIFIYMLGDIAFVPVEVLLVTLIIHRLLGIREKNALLNKMNMVIGAFFSEVGTVLVRDLIGVDRNSSEIKRQLNINAGWNGKDFLKAKKFVLGFDARIEPEAGRLIELKGFLTAKREFMLRLLENPNLLEHDSFTELLWAVFHLTEELGARDKLEGLPAADYEHLSIDIERAYSRLIYEWIFYMAHLKAAYPYLFSLAIRTSPFNPEASPIITE